MGETGRLLQDAARDGNRVGACRPHGSKPNFATEFESQIQDARLEAVYRDDHREGCGEADASLEWFGGDCCNEPANDAGNVALLLAGQEAPLRASA